MTILVTSGTMICVSNPGEDNEDSTSFPLYMAPNAENLAVMDDMAIDIAANLKPIVRADMDGPGPNDDPLPCVDVLYKKEVTTVGGVIQEKDVFCVDTVEIDLDDAPNEHSALAAIVNANK